MIKQIELNETLLERSKQALSAAGQRSLEVAGGAAEEMRIVYESDDFSVSTSGVDYRLGIRSIQENRQGFVSTNSNSPESIRESVEEAFSMSRLSPPSEHYGLAEKAPGREAESYIHEDASLSEMTEGDVVRIAERIIEEATRDPRVRLDRVEVALVRDARSLLNSNGIEASLRRAYINWSAMGMAREGDQVTSFDYDGGVAFRKEDVEQKILDSMGRFTSSVIGSLNPLPARSYQGPVLVHPALVRQFILGTISSNANGKNQQDGISPWKAAKGSRVASPALTVFEDPLDLDRLESYLPFDREGLPTARHDLVRNGDLVFTGHNIYSASRAGEQPTGNASGGAGSTPAVGFFNLKLELGDLEKGDLQQAMNQLGTGLLIKRFSGNADTSSGHFSGVAKNSYWIENGEIAHPVQEVMIAGNLFDVLKQIVYGTNIDFEVMGGARAPYLIVDGVSVTSGR